MDLPDSMDESLMDGHVPGEEDVKNPNEATNVQPTDKEASPHTH